MAARRLLLCLPAPHPATVHEQQGWGVQQAWLHWEGPLKLAIACHSTCLARSISCQDIREA